MYQFKEYEENWQHFWFDKKLITNLNWATLSKASKAVFPVISCHQNERGEAFPSEETIAVLCGISPKTARAGIMGLNGFPVIIIMPYVTNQGRRSKRFVLDSPPRKPGRGFPFYKSIITGGNWLNLTPTAQALYPVMRAFGFFNPRIFSPEDEDETEINDSDDFWDNYKYREFDYCNAEMNILAERAGITRQSLYPALKSLASNGLLENTTDSEDQAVWKIYLRPKVYWKRDHLNKITCEKFKRKDDM